MSQGVYVLGVSIRGVHVQDDYVLEPSQAEIPNLNESVVLYFSLIR